MATDNKYDRQLRLWGPNGQKLLNTSNVLLLNCEPAGVELLKNLVLPGVGNICVMDNKLITERDLGNNFFLDEDHLNKTRAEVICKFLLEMNNDVKGKWVMQDPLKCDKEPEVFFKEFNLIIVNELPEEFAIKINEICEKYQINLIYLYTNGLIGYFRIFGNNHTVIESKPPDAMIEDLRISEPFAELKDFVDSFEMKALDDMEHGHVPYVVLLIKILGNWKKMHNELPPNSFQEKSDFKSFIKTFSRNFSVEENFQEATKNYYKAFKNITELSPALEKIFNSKDCNLADRNSPPFWILSQALKRFYNETKSLPLIGKIPDMTSLTSFYVKLQSVYRQKAEVDLQKVKRFVLEVTNSISDEDLKSFCENSWGLEWINYRSLGQEDSKPLLIESYENDVYKWYFAIKGCQIFENIYKRTPIAEDKGNLERIINEELIKKKFANILPIEREIIEEITRYEGAHLHNIAAFMGGVGAQEAIKLITCQFVPLNNTFIFNGINCESAVFEI